MTIQPVTTQAHYDYLMEPIPAVATLAREYGYASDDTIEVHVDRKQQSLAVRETSVTKEEPKSTIAWLWSPVQAIGDWFYSKIYGEPESVEAVTKSSPYAHVHHASTAMSQEEFNRHVQDMRQLLNRIRDHVEEFADDQVFEDYLLTVFKAQVSDRKDELRFRYDQNASDLATTRNLNADRLAQMDALIKSSATERQWGIFESAASSCGLAIAGATIGGPTIGVAAFLFGIGTMVDALADNYLKHRVAELFTDDIATENTIVATIQMGMGLLTTGASIGLGFYSGGVRSAIQIGSNIASGTSTVGKGVVGLRMNQDRAAVSESSNTITKHQEVAKRATGKIRSLVDAVHEYYKNLEHVARNKRETMLEMVRV